MNNLCGEISIHISFQYYQKYTKQIKKLTNDYFLKPFDLRNTQILNLSLKSI
jgi:hypothetical protein